MESSSLSSSLQHQQQQRRHDGTTVVVVATTPTTLTTPTTTTDPRRAAVKVLWSIDVNISDDGDDLHSMNDVYNHNTSSNNNSHNYHDTASSHHMMSNDAIRMRLYTPPSSSSSAPTPTTTTTTTDDTTIVPPPPVSMMMMVVPPPVALLSLHGEIISSSGSSTTNTTTSNDDDDDDDTSPPSIPNIVENNIHGTTTVVGEFRPNAADNDDPNPNANTNTTTLTTIDDDDDDTTSTESSSSFSSSLEYSLSPPPPDDEEDEGTTVVVIVADVKNEPEPFGEPSVLAVMELLSDAAAAAAAADDDASVQSFVMEKEESPLLFLLSSSPAPPSTVVVTDTERRWNVTKQNDSMTLPSIQEEVNSSSNNTSTSASTTNCIACYPDHSHISHATTSTMFVRPTTESNTRRNVHDRHLTVSIPLMEQDETPSLSPLTFVSSSSFCHNHHYDSNAHGGGPPTTTTNNVPVAWNTTDRPTSKSTIYTLQQQQQARNQAADVNVSRGIVVRHEHSDSNNNTAAAATTATIVQEYQIIQTLRRQSLLYNNNSSCYGTIRLSNCIDDMKADLKYIMMMMQQRQQQNQYKSSDHIYQHPMIRHDLDIDGNNEIVDPVIQWENYMDDSRTTPPAYWPMFTYSLMVVGCAVLMISFHLNSWQMESFRYNSSFGPSSDTLISMGAVSTKLLLSTNDNRSSTGNLMEWYRIVTSIGIHGGILHWIGTMMATFAIGVPMERKYGTVLIGSTFMIASIAANFCTLVYAPFELIVGPMGGICSWIGLLVGKNLTHYSILCHLYDPPNSYHRAISSANTMTVSSPLSRAVAKAPQPFPFLVTKLVIFMELLLIVLLGMLPWIDQFTNCCGFAYGMVIGIHIFQPSGSTYQFVQLCQATYIATTNEMKSKFHRTILLWMYQFYLPIRRRIIPGIFLCVLIGFSTSNVLYLYYSNGIDDLPCRSCHYINCIPWPENIYQHCEPCNYIGIEYVTVNEPTDDEYTNDDVTKTEADSNGISDSDSTNTTLNVSSLKGVVATEGDVIQTSNADVRDGTNYIIEMVCPYGELTKFVVPNQIPQTRTEWLHRCRDYCEL